MNIVTASVSATVLDKWSKRLSDQNVSPKKWPKCLSEKTKQLRTYCTYSEKNDFFIVSESQINFERPIDQVWLEQWTFTLRTEHLGWANKNKLVSLRTSHS